MRKTMWRLGAVAVLGACTGGVEPPAPAAGDAPVVGAELDVTELGVTATALDPTDGTFQAPTEIAPGWLQITTGTEVTYLPKGDRAPDLSYYHFGRHGLRYPTRASMVTVDLDGLDWHAGDSLQLVSPNVGVSIHEFESHFDYPRTGSERVTGARLDWRRAGAPLLDASQHDGAWLAQMTATPGANGSFYSVLTRAGLAAPVTITEASPQALRATLAPVTRDRELALTWQGDAFAALASQAGAFAAPAPAPALAIRTLPAALAEHNNFHRRFYMYLPSLVDFGPVRGEAAFTEHIAYGNPFATPQHPWTDFVTMVYAMPVTLPGLGSAHAMVVQAMPVSALAHAPLAPALSPVRDVRVDGKAADIARTVHASPTITWAAPLTGAATSYTVTVLAPAPNGSGLVAVGTFPTAERSLVLPAFITAAAPRFALVITAISSPGHDLVAHPFAGSLPFASADYVTAPLTR